MTITSASAAVGLEILETFADGLDHPEGIAVTPDGSIYVGGEAGQVYRIGADDRVLEIASTGGFCLGLAADGDGRLYICDQLASTVWRLEPTTGEMMVFTRGLSDRPLAVPNWGCFDARGNYFVTDSGGWGTRNGLIWVVRPGRATEVWSEESRNFPNGCAIAPDGSALYVIESNPSALVEITVQADGRAGRRRVLAELGTVVPDGIAVCADGSLVVACYRPDSILRWSPVKGTEILAHDPQGVVLAAPTNVVFTGPALGTLVVPNLGRWHLTRGDLGIRGTPLFYPTSDELGS